MGLTKNLGGIKSANTTLLMSIFLFHYLGNMAGQLPWKSIHLPQGEFASPTNDINVTAALAVTVLIYYIVQGIIEKGPSYFKHYFKPMLFMTPFNILEDFTRPLNSCSPAFCKYSCRGNFNYGAWRLGIYASYS